MLDIERIRLRRLQLRLSQGQLGKLIGKDQAYISRLERGQFADITVSTLERLARALRVGVDMLLMPDDDSEHVPTGLALAGTET